MENLTPLAEQLPLNEPVDKPENHLEQVEGIRLIDELKSAVDVCLEIRDKLNTSNISRLKAQEKLDSAFIDSGLLQKLKSSPVNPDFVYTITQVLGDPYLLIKFPRALEIAPRAIENSFASAVGQIEKASYPINFETVEDQEKVQSIFKVVGEKIINNSVIDIKFYNYGMGHVPGGNGDKLIKKNGSWFKVSVTDRGSHFSTELIDKEYIEKHTSANADIYQIQEHDKRVVDDIKSSLLEIKMLLQQRGDALPKKICEVLNDMRQELSKMINSSIDDTNPSVLDYAGSGLSGDMLYTGIFKKYSQYRHLVFA